jgi:hypothetical protein
MLCPFLKKFAIKIVERLGGQVELAQASLRIWP